MLSFTFGHVSSQEAANAFAFHREIARSNHHIWPRSLSDLQQYADDGRLFGARETESGKFVALCYVTLDQTETEFEVGGLTTDASVQDLGIGTFLTRTALAHLVAYERPWDYGQEIIAYVHEANQEPRRLLERLGFRFSESVTVPPSVAPASMKKNASGEMVGHKFVLTKAAATSLSEWLSGFDGTLGKTRDQAILNFGHASIEEITQALNSYAPPDH